MYLDSLAFCIYKSFIRTDSQNHHWAWPFPSFQNFQKPIHSQYMYFKYAWTKFPEIQSHKSHMVFGISNTPLLCLSSDTSYWGQIHFTKSNLTLYATKQMSTWFAARNVFGGATTHSTTLCLNLKQTQTFLLDSLNISCVLWYFAMNNKCTSNA